MKMFEKVNNKLEQMEKLFGGISGNPINLKVSVLFSRMLRVL